MQQASTLKAVVVSFRVGLSSQRCLDRATLQEAGLWKVDGWLSRAGEDGEVIVNGGSRFTWRQ